MISTKEESTKACYMAGKAAVTEAGQLWKVAGAVEKVWKSVWV